MTVDKKDLDLDVSKAKQVKTREQELAEREKVPVSRCLSPPSPLAACT